MKTNKKEIIVLSFIISAFAGGFIYGRWYRGAPTEPVVNAHSARKILSYTCSMHPTYKSDKPGKCPMCDMDLEAVYADEGKPAGAEVAGMAISAPRSSRSLASSMVPWSMGPSPGR